MTQIESAALAWISFAIAGNAIFAIALSSTDRAIPTARFRIAQYRCGSGSPSSAVFILSRRPPLGMKGGDAVHLSMAAERARPSNTDAASAHSTSPGALRNHVSNLALPVSARNLQA